MAVRIGELLLKEKRITPEQLQKALSHQKANGGKLGFNLVQLGLVKDEDITALLSKQYGVPSINLAQFDIDVGVVKLIPAETAHKYQIIPLSRAGATLTIAMTDPTNVFAMDDIKFMTGYNVEPVVASESAVVAAIEKYYPNSVAKSASSLTVAAQGPSTLEMASRGLEELQASLEGDAVEVPQLRRSAPRRWPKRGEEAPVVRLATSCCCIRRARATFTSSQRRTAGCTHDGIWQHHEPADEVPRGDCVAREDHGEARHRRGACLTRNPLQRERRRQGSTSACPAADAV
jgi:type IV pilus assembly protein PilB